MVASTHPSPDTLAAFRQGRLAETSAAAVEQHLRDCPACRKRLDRAADTCLRPLRETADRGTVVAGGGAAGQTAVPGGKHAATASDDIPSALADHDRYKVLQVLGHGGMGTVYLAQHRLMDRQDALKLIHPEYLARPEIRQRFEREIVAAGKLSHPNIVQAYDAFPAGDALVLAMEYIDGIDLAAYVTRKGPMEVPLACRCVQQAALGLQYAHGKEMVHRDIKPHNLMITRKGQVKILDFGLAQLARGPAGDSGLTRDGVVMGTPDYLAPEQWLAPSEVDIRADLYGLGCTLYFLLTGRPPFRGPGTLALLRQHSDDPPPKLRKACPDAPEGLEQVYQRLMAKVPQDRYATPKEVAQALAPFVKGTTAPGSLAPLPRLAHPVAPTRTGGGSETQSPEPLVFPSRAPSTRRHRPGGKAKRWLPVAAGGGVVAVVVLALLVILSVIIRSPTGVVEPTSAVLVLDGVPIDVEVRVDGQWVEVRYHTDQPADLTVMPGTRRVEVRKRGFEVFGEQVTVFPGEHRVLTVTLRPLPAAPAEVGKDAPSPPAAGNVNNPVPSSTRPVLGGKTAGELTTVSLSAGVEMIFAWIPPGSFLMGSPPDEAERRDDETQHRVALTQGYWLGVHEVTQKQWKAVMGSSPSRFKGDDLPVETVLWDDCQAFCRKLGEKTGKRCRLPTEAEWEYACRAGTTTPFHFGVTISTDQANYDGNHKYGRGKKGTYRQKTTPVGSFAPNAWGLYEMHGNVWEWCQDRYGVYHSKYIKDPQGSQNGTDRVLRGGAWDIYTADCRAAYRCRCGPGYRKGNIGCRVVLCLDSPPASAGSSKPAETGPGARSSTPPPPAVSLGDKEVTGRRAGEVARMSLSAGVEMIFAWIPPGSFLMGSLEGEEGRDSTTGGGGRGRDHQQHRVTLTRGYYMSVYPVTNRQFASFVTATRYKTQAEQKDGAQYYNGKIWVQDRFTNWKKSGYYQTGDHPAVCVSWHDAMAFCGWLQSRSRLSTHARLPTEAEWEYACRAGTTTPFHFGNTISTDQANYNGAVTYGNGKRGPVRRVPTPVGSFPPNAWGLYDMHGNVWQWCHDWYADSDPPNVIDPRGSVAGQRRVQRGGCWQSEPEHCRSACRFRGDPNDRSNGIGFRVILCDE